jgi:Reverse transcriptase (RNA-dependent DNA polymerase)
MDIPQGFERFYEVNSVLKLLRTLYGLVQAAMAFWQKIVLMFATIGFKQSKADPYLFFKCSDHGLCLCISYIDNLAGTGSKNAVLQSKKSITQIFECDKVGEMNEYVGCKIQHNKKGGWMKLTQPVLLQSLKDEFVLPNEILSSPAVPGEVLSKDDDATYNAEQKYYCKGVGKLLHLAKWSRVEVQNVVRELSRHMAAGSNKHIQAMHRTMSYLVQSPNRGLLLKPNSWQIRNVRISVYRSVPWKSSIVTTVYVTGECFYRTFCSNSHQIAHFLDVKRHPYSGYEENIR